MADSITQSRPGELQELNGWRKQTAIPPALNDCALIVPTYKRIEELFRLLSVVVEFDDPPGEIIVVDGSPGDDLNFTLREWAGGVDLPFDLVYVKSPAGLTRQRNVGLDACSKSFLYFLDDDCVPEPNYFRAIRDVFEKDECRQIGAIRGFLTNCAELPVNLLWKLRYRLGIVPTDGPGLYHNCGTSCTWNGIPAFRGIKEIDVLAGGAAAYRREVFDKHRFSQFFYGYSQGEDLEMSLRIRKDWKIVLCGDARVDHREASHGRPPGFARGRMVFRNRYFIWKRHSAKPGFKNTIRFWADQLLVISYNVAAFVFRPWRPYYIGYAAGVAGGVVQCIMNPPRYEEPLARRQYTFVLR